MVDAIVTLTKSNWHVSHLSEMSEKIAKKMEMIQNLRGVADCPAMSFVFVC